MSPRTSIRKAPTAGTAVSVPLLGQQQAAALAGCSKDTIARARRAGRFPHARLAGGRWSIPADDLAAAGFAPPDVVPDSQEPPLAARPEDGPVDLPLARAEARIAALEDLVARQDAELAFLRQLAADTVAKKAS
jgi:excisionase family DNA binding protein